MNEQLREQLVQDLEKSGFYSEMQTIRTFNAANWECRGSFTYFDKDERTTRECDFEAVREWEGILDRSTGIGVATRFIGQVKKSEKPWIVFVDRTRHRPAYTPEVLLQMTDEKNRWKVSAALRDPENAWTGSGIHEAFKRPSDTSRWYSAFVSVCKACETAYESDGPVRTTVIAQLITPIVVVDGVLVVAELGEDANVVLTEIEHAPFRFEYRSDCYDRAAYYPDLVTLAGLPRYLERTAERMNALLRALEEGGER
jgi:hypothetical protein